MTFQFWPVENTAPPPLPPQKKLKFRHFLAFYDFSILTSGEYPPPGKLEFRPILRLFNFDLWRIQPPRKLKFRHFLAFYDFSILTSGEYTPSPPENWNLGITWHFMTFQFWPVENTPPPPPLPENWNLGISWHFMTFQFWPVENTAPPPPTARKLKFRHFLAFYDFSILTSGEYPPPHFLAFYDFSNLWRIEI